ncbi:MAG: M23 family metallopeptidase [Gammaproteobacteria bacterium]|nr:M23 family metallopeptidase [Gammaproteobacteria bacterium]
MHILLIPGNTRSGSQTCLSARQVLLAALVALLVLPLGIGSLAYHANRLVERANNPQLDGAQLARLESIVAGQRDEVDAARRFTRDHLNALAAQLGKMNAQVMRVNALGQRLVRMAGLDEGEFDFSNAPAMGGPEPIDGGTDSRDLAETLDQLSGRIDDRMTEMQLLETFLMDRQLQSDLNPAGWPVDGGYVSSGFGNRRDPFNGKRDFHAGVDIANKLGAPVKAVASGVVTHVDHNRGGYGLMVEINHGNGYRTRYAHNLEAMVEVGQRVEKGQQIALVGSSGRSTAPHLHFEILRDGRAINPRRNLRLTRK